MQKFFKQRIVNKRSIGYKNRENTKT